MGDDWLKVMNAQTEAVIEKNDNPPLKAKVKRINNNGTIDVSVDLPEQEMPWEIPGIPLTNNLKISKGDYVTVKFLENNPNSPVIDGMFNPKSYSGDGEDGRSILSVDKVESDGLVDIYRITYSKEPVYSYFQVKNGDNANITSISISDLNNAIETGFYNCYSADNAPTSGFYTIEANTDGSNVIQTATNANGEMYTRIGYDVQNNPSWSEWTESGGSGSETAQSILDKLKTVDGIGSGLNADLLDGKHASEFATSTQGTKADNAVPTSRKINNKPLTSDITLTKSDISLGNVDNTSDANKPISTATQTALNDKVDKITGKELSTNDYTTTEKNKLNGIANGAEVNIQPDWNQTNNTQDDYIKNKPTIPTTETPSTILTKILTVDGTGSGLDADLLDGKHANEFATISDLPIINTGSFTIASVTANTDATTNITMPQNASINKVFFWSHGGTGYYFIYCGSTSGTTWTIRHRWFGSATNRTVYYAWW